MSIDGWVNWQWLGWVGFCGLDPDPVRQHLRRVHTFFGLRKRRTQRPRSLHILNSITPHFLITCCAALLPSRRLFVCWRNPPISLVVVLPLPFRLSSLSRPSLSRGSLTPHISAPQQVPKKTKKKPRVLHIQGKTIRVVVYQGRLFKIGFDQENVLHLLLVGTDTLGSLLGGSLDGLLGGEDGGDAGKSGLEMQRVVESKNKERISFNHTADNEGKNALCSTRFEDRVQRKRAKAEGRKRVE